MEAQLKHESLMFDFVTQAKYDELKHLNTLMPIRGMVFLEPNNDLCSIGEDTVKALFKKFNLDELNELCMGIGHAAVRGAFKEAIALE